MIKICLLTAAGASLLAASSISRAGEHLLDCKLYIAESLDHASSYALESTENTLNSLRRGGICVFPDGSVADKQFVMAVNIRSGGAIGDSVGLSTYTFENGDSLTLSFTGGWDNSPFTGDYQVMNGTGAYANATGTGTIVATDSPWKSTGIVDIHLDVTTPDS